MASRAREARVAPGHLFFSGPLPRVLAHRGLHLSAAENTMSAFRAAVAAGATHLETDVRASADGEAMLVHDQTLERVAGSDRRVASLTRRQLAGTDLGFGEGVPGLAELLDAFPEARINIDVKEDAAVAPAVDAIRSTRAERRVLVTSFSSRRQRALAAALPDAATSPAWERVLAGVVAAKNGGTGLVQRIFARVDAIQFPPRSHGIRFLTPRVLEAFHRTGCELHVWTINDPVAAVELFDLGVHGVFTDRADLVLPLAAARR